jgi:hypothetical protein
VKICFRNYSALPWPVILLICCKMFTRASRLSGCWLFWPWNCGEEWLPTFAPFATLEQMIKFFWSEIVFCKDNCPCRFGMERLPGLLFYCLISLYISRGFLYLAISSSILFFIFASNWHWNSGSGIFWSLDTQAEASTYSEPIERIWGRVRGSLSWSRSLL